MSIKPINARQQGDAQKQYEQLLASINGIIWEIDPATLQFVFVSQQAEQMLGYPVAAWYEPNFWANHLHPEDRAWLLECCQQTIHTQHNRQVEYRMIAAGGETVWLQDMLTVVVIGDQVIKLRGIMTDITRHKSAASRATLDQTENGFAGNIDRLVGAGRDVTQPKETEVALLISETHYRSFIDHATDAFFLLDKRGAILDVNRQACANLGYSREELLGALPNQYDPDVTPTQSQKILEQLRDGKLVTFDSRHQRKDGSTFPVEVRIQPILVDGHPLGICLVRDISERKRVQEALTLFRALIDHTADSIEVIDPATGRYLDVNEQACQVHGYTHDEFLTLNVTDLDPQIHAWEESGGTQPWSGPHVFESVHRRKDGSLFPVEVKANYIRLDRDYVVTVVRDVTERQQAEAALRESEERYRTLFEDNPSMYFMVDANGTISSVNRFGAEKLGYTIAELTEKSALDLFYGEEDKVAAARVLQQCLDYPNQLFHANLRKVHKDGHVLWVNLTARAVSKMNGASVVLIVCEDITERKRAEQALAESHNLLNAVVEGTEDAIYVKDLAGRYLMINTAGARFLGKHVDEIIGKDDRDLFTSDTVENVLASDRQVWATGEAQMFEETATAADVTRTYLATKNVYRDAQGKVIGLIGISRDITDLKRLEEQLRQAQKMEAVGRLAGGVAHDFNNILTVINGYSELIIRRLSEQDPNRKRLIEIQKAGERATNLTHQLLAFSRKQVLQPQVVNLNTLLAELFKLLQRLIGEDIELTFISDHALGLTKVDPGQFEQAIINLAVNARDAMPEGGELIIETHNTELDETYRELYPEVRPGRYDLVTVRDTGHGMDMATQSRIFEPFFTTKEVGKGTGLGLAMVYGFVKQSEGHIEVASELARGTTFKIYLPCVTENLPGLKSVASVQPIPNGAETVLLVEDERAVRGLTKSILQSSGYTVLEASNGEEALSLAQQHQGPIDILVTDLVMPRMSGRQLADQMVRDRPNLRLLFMSGYTDEATLHQSSVDFLQKPFDPTHLAHKVRQVLDADARTFHI